MMSDMSMSLDTAQVADREGGNMRAAMTDGDHSEHPAAGWAPLRDPSLRSGSLRSAQPAAGAKRSPRRKNSRGVPFEPKDKEVSPLPSQASSVVQRMGSTLDATVEATYLRQLLVFKG